MERYDKEPVKVSIRHYLIAALRKMIRRKQKEMLAEQDVKIQAWKKVNRKEYKYLIDELNFRDLGTCYSDSDASDHRMEEAQVEIDNQVTS